MVRALALTLAALAGLAVPLVAADTPVPTTATATADRLAPLARIVDLAIAGGLPDAKGATLHLGKIGVIWRFDADNKHVNQTEGIHAKLADGRWLVGLVDLKTAADLEIDEAALKPVALENLAAALSEGKEQEFPAEAIEGWIQNIAPADRDRVRAAIPALPVAMALFQNGRQAPAVAVAALIRLEAPCAEDVAVLAGLMQAGNPFAPSFAATAPPLTFGEEEHHWGREMHERKEIAVPDPALALRHGLFIHFRSIATGMGDAYRSKPAAPTGPTPAEALATAATLLAADEAIAQADLALLRGRAALPEKVGADAPLAERLAVWDGGLAGAGATDDDGHVVMRSHGAYVQQQGTTTLTVTEADLDALFALLDDPRPCRWLDNGHARTLGDNALRAIGALFSCDPRSFIARDLAAPWTPAERAATAAALRAWRTANKAKPLDEILVAAVPTMKPADLANLLTARPPDRRAPLLAAAAKAWAAGPPAKADDNAIAAVITAAGEDAGLLAAVASWPVAGDLAPLLAGFHLTRGNSKPLDDLLTATLSGISEEAMNFYQVIPMVRYAPTPAQVQRLSEALRGPLDAMPGMMLVPMVAGGLSHGDDGLLAAWATRQAKGDQDAADRRSQTLPLALYALLLADDRALTPQLRQQAVEIRRHSFNGKPAEKSEPAADLRVADYAGAYFQMLGWQMSDLLGETLRERGEELAVDLAKPLAERDRQLTALRREIANVLAPALEAAGLPNLAPGVAPAAGDDKALF